MLFSYCYHLINTSRPYNCNIYYLELYIFTSIINKFLQTTNVTIYDCYLGITSSRSMCVPYGFREVQSRTKYILLLLSDSRYYCTPIQYYPTHF